MQTEWNPPAFGDHDRLVAWGREHKVEFRRAAIRFSVDNPAKTVVVFSVFGRVSIDIIPRYQLADAIDHSMFDGFFLNGKLRPWTPAMLEKKAESAYTADR